MSDKPADLQQFLSLSRAMLERARCASWDEVAKLEAKRRELLGTFFLAPVPAELASAVSEAIGLIIAIDHKIMELGRAEKLDLEQALRQIDQGKRAVKAYSS
jgi:hypothetical protein